jgi:membrane protein implicated in regulation of membrane protease activity
MEVKATAPKFSLSQNDFVKGLVMAVGTPVIAVLLATVQAGSWQFDWNLLGTTAVSALLMYLGKNFFTGPSLVVTDPSKNMVKEAEEGNLEVVKK